jgi:hypothetical protein
MRDIPRKAGGHGFGEGSLAHLASADQAHHRKLAKQVSETLQMGSTLDHTRSLP